MRKRIHFVSVIFVGLMVFSAVGFSQEQPPQTTHAKDKVSRLFRPIDTIRESIGIFSLKEKVLGGNTGYQPYFTEFGTGLSYEISDCDDACLEAIQDCVDGELCKIRAEFTKGAFPSTFIKEFEVISGEVKETASGAKFTRVSPKELKALKVDAIKCGEAWRDPSGMVWCDIKKKEDGSPDFMNHKDATDYCKGIGARLPTGYPEDMNGKGDFPNKDSDFVRLRKNMGAVSVNGYQTFKGYTPAEFFPSLTYTKEDGTTGSRWFWSSSGLPDYSNSAYYFVGRIGYIYYYSRDYSGDVSVRCVVEGR